MGTAYTGHRHAVVMHSGLMGNLHERNRNEQIHRRTSKNGSQALWTNGSVKPIKTCRSFSRHIPIEGAKFGGERLVMLGNDLVLSGSLVKNQRFNYVAMGHIHKPQDVNEGHQPPVIYPAPSSAWILARQGRSFCHC
ncbi:hypothetical protein [Candidatus Villigracilis affinis]|uniref:hypothetical protein n=1 Tax=Candidatus Villigracilis affinis TaxID=3140682 RepID=UPI002A1E86DA|nr:hypothetical protein [Anaerolineales bacterium]